MDLYTAGIFIVTLLIAVYSSSNKHFKWACWCLLGCSWLYYSISILGTQAVNAFLTFCVPFIFGEVIGTAISVFAESRNDFLRREWQEEYSENLRELPEHTEIFLEEQNRYCFLIEEGDLAAHVFLVTKTGKEDGEYVYGDILDNPMENLNVTKESRNIGELLLTHIILRERLGYEPKRNQSED